MAYDMHALLLSKPVAKMFLVIVYPGQFLQNNLLSSHFFSVTIKTNILTTTNLQTENALLTK